MGTEKMRNLPTMYSEAEPGSRASGASEGNLPVIPHHGPSACPWPWAPTVPQHVPQGSRAPRRAGTAWCLLAPLPRGCHHSWPTLWRETQSQEPQRVEAAPAGGQGSVAQAPHKHTLSTMFTAQLSVSAVLLNAHFYTFSRSIFYKVFIQ